MRSLFLDRSARSSPLVYKLCAGLAAAAGALALSAATASAATITVTTGLDEFDTTPSTTCSLREAIESAKTDADFGGCTGTGGYGNDTIVFAPAVTLVQLSITSGSGSNDNNSFLDLDILDTNPIFPNDLIIDGGAGVTIQPLAPGWADRIFDIPQNPVVQPGAVTLRNLTIQGGGSPGSDTGGGNPCFNSGGGVRNWSGGPLTLSNVTIQNNVMPANGGGVCQQTAGNLSISGSTIRNNVATNFNGGGVAYFANNTLSIQNSTVLSNTAFRAGGGIYDQSNSMIIQDSQVLSNTVNGPSGVGGGVWTVGGTAPKQILTSTVAYNRADGDGGGVYNQTVRGLQLIGSTVLSNTAGAFLNNPGDGGGIWSSASLFLNNSDVLSNTALFSSTATPLTPPGGGGIYQQGAPLGITGGQVAYNAARALTGSEIAGGGIWNSGIANLDNARVEHNQADGTALAGGQAYGGGIYNENRVALANNTQVSDNRAEAFFASGGGISSRNIGGGSAQLLAQDSVVSDNTAQGDPANGLAWGGGIHNGSGGTADLLSTEVRDNLASGGQFAQGGGIASDDTLTVTSSLVNSNVATVTAAFGGSQGGGILSLGNVALITGTQIHSNTAGTGGGWGNFVAGAQLVNSDARFNQAAGDDGGGVYNQGPDTQIVKSAVCQNQARQHGGGVFNTFNFMAINESIVCDNQAGTGGAGDGGGVYNGANGSIFISLSQVLTNSAPDNGGGVYNADFFAGISDSLLRANQATDGGGAYNATGSMNVSASVVRDNQATNNGGGVYNATGANVIVIQSTLDSNSASAGAGLYNIADATLGTNAVINNTASATGGGAHNAATGVLNIENNTFSGNSAPAGGGLYNITGATYLTHTTIASNTGGSGINAAGGVVEVLATLLAYNAGNDCVGTVTDNGFSMSSDASCSGFVSTGTDPLLQPLALNGGPTLNHALAPGSPALDQVASCGTLIDQRFVSRPQGVSCDVGAFELEEADLEVSKSADPSTVIAGQTITYTVIVTNLSTTGAANSIVLTDTLLGGATFGGVVSSGGFSVQSSTSSQAVFALASLPAGSSATLVFTATAPGSGPITNTVAVSSNNPDPDPSNNTDSISTPVSPAAYLTVNKAQDYVPHAPGVVLPGGTVTYTIVVTNNGPSDAPVSIQDTLASGVSYVSAGGSGWSCSFSAPTVSCNHLTPLSAGASATVLITVTAPTASSTVFTNTADGFAPAFPGTPFSSNVVTLTTAASADLRVGKTATPSPVFAGQPVTYVVTVQNFGPDAAANVVITDVFQGGATFGSVVATSGGATLQSSSSTGVTFTVASLSVGNAAAMTYTVIAPASGVITNTATAVSDAVDPVPASNSVSTSTPVTPVANLSISKAQSYSTNITGTIRPGGTLTYTLLVTNSGPSSATSVTVTDNLPAGLTYVSASGSGWSCGFSAPTVTCTAATLSVGAAPAIQIVATAPVTPGVVLTNTASVNAATYPNTPATSNSVVVKVQYRVFAPIVRKP